jgi:hypothetical protein
VLDITPAPHVLRVRSNEFFGVKFTWAINNGYINQIVQLDGDAREFRERMVRQRQPFCPVMAIPGQAKKASAGTGSMVLHACASVRYGSNLTTLFCFPAEDSELPPSIQAQLGTRPIILNDQGRRILRKFVTGDLTTILPFVIRLERVSVFEIGRLVYSGTRSPTLPAVGMPKLR